MALSGNVGAVTKYLGEYPAVDPDSCELMGPTALVHGSFLASFAFQC